MIVVGIFDNGKQSNPSHSSIFITQTGSSITAIGQLPSQSDGLG